MSLVVASISLSAPGHSLTNFFALLIVYNESQAKLSRYVIIKNAPFGSNLARPSNQLDPPVKP